MNEAHYSYMLASKPRGAIYVGFAPNLLDVVEEHKANLVDGLTSLYAIHLLVYYASFEQSGPALLHANALRKMHRHDKLALVEHHNPEWRDLYENLVQEHARQEAALA